MDERLMNAMLELDDRHWGTAGDGASSGPSWTASRSPVCAPLDAGVAPYGRLRS